MLSVPEEYYKYCLSCVYQMLEVVMQDCHLLTATKQCLNYILQCQNAKEVAAAHKFKDFHKSAPNSLPATFHYSFDLAQQVHNPVYPMQPGPIYFKVLRHSQSLRFFLYMLWDQKTSKLPDWWIDNLWQRSHCSDFNAALFPWDFWSQRAACGTDSWQLHQTKQECINHVGLVFVDGKNVCSIVPVSPSCWPATQSSHLIGALVF